MAVWPSKRADGTLSVAARFESDRADALETVRDRIARWLAEKAALGVDIDRDLTRPPEPETIGSSSIEIVFHGRTRSRWKDWLVDLTGELSSIPGLRLVGFEDRVSGRFRRAATRR